MKVDHLKVGELKCNCYLVEKDQNCLLIDPGAEYENIIHWVGNKKIIGILITHHHFDHIGCIEQLTKTLKYPVYSSYNLEEGPMKIANFSFEVIKTNGHSMDSLTYYFKEEAMMFTGDFLFYHTIGRCDLEGSDEAEMIKSIEKIKKYPDNITVYPGHGKFTNLGNEKKENPYF